MYSTKKLARRQQWSSRRSAHGEPMSNLPPVLSCNISRVSVALEVAAQWQYSLISYRFDVTLQKIVLWTRCQSERMPLIFGDYRRLEKDILTRLILEPAWFLKSDLYNALSFRLGHKHIG